MIWLLMTIGEFVSSFSRMRNQDEPEEQVHENTPDRASLLDTLRQHPGSRKQNVHMIGPEISPDGTAWNEEQIEFSDENNVENLVNIKEGGRCSCGTVIGYGTSLVGFCSVCGRSVCNREGCCETCSQCGALVCQRHAVKYGDHVFCVRHRLLAWWLIFWGCIK